MTSRTTKGRARGGKSESEGVPPHFTQKLSRVRTAGRARRGRDRLKHHRLIFGVEENGPGPRRPPPSGQLRDDDSPSTIVLGRDE